MEEQVFNHSQALSKEQAKRYHAERQLQELLEVQNDLAARLAEEEQEKHWVDQALCSIEANWKRAERLGRRGTRE